jgi:conjugative relaxase-like TrwC/TraI family protein
LVATFAVIHRPAYYTSQPSAYYQADGETRGVWLRGNNRLGVTPGSAVDPQTFDLLCEGCDAFGNKLVNTPPGKRRMLGIDITLSSPKAVSALYAVADEALRESIAAAERTAVEATLTLVENEIPLARRGKRGLRPEYALFTAAVFTHSEARPEKHADGSVLASVQRHHHVCIPSICERPSDGSFGAINSVVARNWKKSLGARFRLVLASELQRRGFAIERDEDSNWRWGIAGVPAEICTFFSARRNAIEAELAEFGLTSAQAPAVAAAITRKNRHAKESVSSSDRFAQWRAAVEALGFKPDAIVADALQRGREAAATATPKSQEVAIAARIAEVPKTLTSHEATFERRDLVEAVSNALVGTAASAEQADREAANLIARGALVGLGVVRNSQVYSTPEMMATERRVVENTVDLAHAHVVAPDVDLVRRLCDEAGLSEEQRQVALAATSARRLTCVLGKSGTGKSTALSVIARSWESAGFSVRGASVAWKAAHALRDGVKVPSRSIDSLLMQADMGKPVFGPKTVCLVDESGLQSSPQLARLLDHVRKGSSSAVLVMVGDESQARPIGPGHAIRLVREAVGAVTLNQIHRQREVWAREAPQAFARGDAKAALQAFNTHGLVEMHDGLRPTVEALADAWQHARHSNSNTNVLVLAKTNAEARAITSILRARLRDEGVIRGREVSLPAVDASGNPFTLRIARGDTIVSLCRLDRIGVVNGTPLVVERITVSRITKSVKITAKLGADVVTFRTGEFADAKGRIRLGSGLVSTIFKAQGATVDQALVLLTDRYDRHDSYVAASRARGDTRFFLNKLSVDGAIRAESGEFHAPITDTERFDHLAIRLSRERVKTTTLDLIDIAQYAERHATRERRRTRELGHEL